LRSRPPSAVNRRLARLAKVSRGEQPLKRGDVLKSRQRIYWRNRQGTLYASGWPRRRGKTKTPLQQAIVDQFTQVAKVTPYVHPIERVNAEPWLANSAWYWRDVIHSAMSGKLIMDEGAVRITTPAASISAAVSASLAANPAWTNIAFTTKNYDNYTWWNPASPGRFTAKEPGLYFTGLWFVSSAAQSGLKQIQIIRNGSVVEAQSLDHSNFATWWGDSLMTVVYLQKDDYLQVRANRSGTAFTISVWNWFIVAITPEAVS